MSASSARKRLRAAIAVAGVTCTAVTLLITAPAAAAPTSAVGGTQSVTAPNPDTSRAAGANSFDFWTQERIAEAVASPADITATATEQQRQKNLPAPAPIAQKNISVPVAPAAASASEPSTRASYVTPRTLGKLIFQEPNGSVHSCSGATINSAAKNLIETAGHCVYTVGQGWHTNILFIPHYYNGVGTDGSWRYKTARTFNGWINDGNGYYDQAFISFYKTNNVELVNKVGGNGLTIGAGQRQSSARIWGYPADPPYTGELSYWCEGATYIWNFSTHDAAMECPLTGGASGGPWYIQKPNPDIGYVYAVTSRRTLSGVPSLIATPNHADVQTMYKQMG